MRLLSLWGILLFGLFIPLSSSAQLDISAGFYNEDIQVFFLSDFDLTGTGASPLIFWVRLENQTGVGRDVSLSLTIESQNYGIIAEGTTEPFTLGPNEIEEITNQNLFSQVGRYKLQNYSIEDAVAEDLKNIILQTGKLPSDTYIFRLTVQDAADPSISDTEEIVLNITNPTTLDLISPGARVDGGELPEIYTTLPQFQWNSNASRFEITICEKLPTNTSPEDVMNNTPRFQHILPDPPEFPDPLSLQYPSTGAWPLEEGKTYYWQVKALITTSSGTVELESEIWGFKIGNLTRGALAPEMLRILSILRDLLGDEVIDGLLGEGGELEGFRPTGVVLEDGRRITLEELTTLIEKLRRGELQITSFFVE